MARIPDRDPRDWAFAMRRLPVRFQETEQSWLKRRHPMKGQRWIYKQYFQQRGSRNWIFGVPNGGPELIKAADITIVRHVKIKAQAHPFDPMWTDYLNARKLFSKLKSGWDRIFGPSNAQETLE